MRHRAMVEGRVGARRRVVGLLRLGSTGCSAMCVSSGVAHRAQAHRDACHTHRWCCYQSDEVHAGDGGTATVERARATTKNAPLSCISITSLQLIEDLLASAGWTVVLLGLGDPLATWSAEPTSSMTHPVIAPTFSGLCIILFQMQCLGERYASVGTADLAWGSGAHFRC